MVKKAQAPRPVTPHRDVDRSKRGGKRSKGSGARAKALADVFGKKA